MPEILFKRERGDNFIKVHAIDGDKVFATGTWTRMPGPREIYWSHGLVVEESYRRNGVATNIREMLLDSVPDGTVIMLSAAHGNTVQHEHVTKLGYDRILENPQEEFCVYAKVKTPEGS